LATAEQPLWDIPEGCLARCEAAAYLVAEVRIAPPAGAGVNVTGW
jgi:hypothetical protein